MVFRQGEWRPPESHHRIADKFIHHSLVFMYGWGLQAQMTIEQSYMSDGVSLSDKLVKPTRSANRTVIVWRPPAKLAAPCCNSTRSRIRGSMYLPNVCLICSFA